MANAMSEEVKNRGMRFLEEYEQLIIRHGVYIGSCGCCDGPQVYEYDPEYDGKVSTIINHLKESLK